MPNDIKKLCQKHMVSPTEIEIKATGVTVDKIEHNLLHVKEEEKYALLKDITIKENPDSCIIFCRTQERVDDLRTG